ncbi:hypothetical protein GCK32_004150 [Trichostrongylus colubriformis]|uniref:Fas-binding factor 1 C-terminal domain-containing protein n=1 Tax=Trichostrongylus colubriformis TaxID=6319 RepID=A0AAN8FWU2_TRICO
MTDEGLSGLLGEMDELDSSLFGRSTGMQAKPSLGNLDSLFDDTRKSTTKKASVSFLEKPSTSAAVQHVPTKSALDDLFVEAPNNSGPVVASITPTQTIARPVRQQTRSSALGALLGLNQKGKETAPQAITSTLASTSAPAPAHSAVRAPEDILREKRLENEIERLYREIDELKRRKREDEMEIEHLWKEKLSKKDHDCTDELKNLEDQYQKHLLKLKSEHEHELENLKITYARQLDVIQQTTGEWKDVTTVVNKVDTLSSTLNHLADNVNMVTERSLLEKETTLRTREEQLNNREQRLLEDRTQFDDERKKVYELNAKLKELCRTQEIMVGQDKYRIREEWIRLNVEKQAFVEDQKFVLQNIEKQAAFVENSKLTFFHEQHDLLARISAERQLLEQEKNEFHGKRSQDVRRLKEEATELQKRADNILAAESHVEKLRRHYEMKSRQLQELEISLMEECMKMEDLRGQLSQSQHQALENGNRECALNKLASASDLTLNPSCNDQEISQRKGSVNNVLKKHSKFLERYMGQKVAAVAPRPVNFTST